MVTTRGFLGRRHSSRNAELPPGQYDSGNDWPVLHAEATPSIATDTWTFTIDGLVDNPVTWNWDEIHELPKAGYQGAIHCVTTWTKFGMNFEGVSLDTLLEIARPQEGAPYVMARSHTGYTTNLPLADLVGGQAWVVWNEGGAALPTIHGGPARLLVPHLYFWKSAKWVAGLTFMAEDKPGFWERGGYHNHGDPWLEQRYQGD